MKNDGFRASDTIASSDRLVYMKSDARQRSAPQRAQAFANWEVQLTRCGCHICGNRTRERLRHGKRLAYVEAMV